MAIGKGAGVQEEQAQAGADFLDAYARQGPSEIGQDAVSMSYLSILQDLSDAVKNKIAEAGQFFNTGTQMALGTEVRVIPVAYKPVWDEREVGGITVARYEPFSIEVQEVPTPAGKKGFPKKINPLTGNEIISTFAYAVVLADHPDAGFLMLTAGVGSMKTFRRWNTMLQQIKTPSGMPGEIFLKVWKMTCSSKISKTTNKTYYGLDAVTDDGWVDKDVFAQAVIPARQNSTQLLLSAPTATDTVVEDAE